MLGAEELGVGAFERDLALPREKARQAARADTGAARVDGEQAHVARTIAGPHRDHERGGDVRVAHENLGAVEPIALAYALGAHGDALRSPRRVRLGDRDGEHALAAGDGGQDRAPLRHACTFQHGQRTEHAGAEERARQRPAPELLVEHAGVRERALAAAVLRGQEHAEPPGIGGLAPELGDEARVGALEGDDRVRRRLALEERPRGPAKHLLGFGEGEIHVSVP
jgi:hypothetical protein